MYHHWGCTSIYRLLYIISLSISVIAGHLVTSFRKTKWNKLMDINKMMFLKVVRGQVIRNIERTTQISDISFRDLRKIHFNISIANQLILQASLLFLLRKKVNQIAKLRSEIYVTIPTMRMTAHDSDKWHFITVHQTS